MKNAYNVHMNIELTPDHPAVITAKEIAAKLGITSHEGIRCILEGIVNAACEQAISKA